MKKFSAPTIDWRNKTARDLDQAGIFGLNIMAAPVAGKTSTILRTIKVVRFLRSRSAWWKVIRATVTIDADKVIAAGMPAVQINTGGECHSTR